MFYQIAYLPEAIQDIESTFSYILETYQDAFAAANTIDAIQKRIDSLNFMPKRHRFDENYYFVTAKNYKIYYIVKRKMVFIVRILHFRHLPDL